MTRTIPWYRSIGGKLGATLVVLLAVSLLSAIGSYHSLSAIRAEAAWVNLSAGNRWRYYHLMHLTNRLVDTPPGEGRSRLKSRLDAAVADLERRNDLIQRGDPAQGIPTPTEPSILEGIRERLEHWNTSIKPILTDRITPKATREEVKGDLDRLETLVTDQVGRVTRGLEQAQQLQAETIRRSQVFQIASAAAALVVLGIAYTIARGITGRVRSLAATADRIAGGSTRSQRACRGGMRWRPWGRRSTP